MRLERVGCEYFTCSSKIIWFTNNWSCNHPSCWNASHRLSLGYADESSHTKTSTTNTQHFTPDCSLSLASERFLTRRKHWWSGQTVFLAASTLWTLTGSCHFKRCFGVESGIESVLHSQQQVIISLWPRCQALTSSLGDSPRWNTVGDPVYFLKYTRNKDLLLGFLWKPTDMIHFFLSKINQMWNLGCMTQWFASLTGTDTNSFFSFFLYKISK